MKTLRVVLCVHLLTVLVHCSEEQQHQEHLEKFTAHCCPKGLFLDPTNNTCVEEDGSDRVAENNFPSCPDGMFLLNPNEDTRDIFKEAHGEIHLVEYEDEEDSIYLNGS
jgi:hypothetical protein